MAVRARADHCFLQRAFPGRCGRLERAEASSGDQGSARFPILGLTEMFGGEVAFVALSFSSAWKRGGAHFAPRRGRFFCASDNDDDSTPGRGPGRKEVEEGKEKKEG